MFLGFCLERHEIVALENNNYASELVYSMPTTEEAGVLSKNGGLEMLSHKTSKDLWLEH